MLCTDIFSYVFLPSPYAVIRGLCELVKKYLCSRVHSNSSMKAPVSSERKQTKKEMGEIRELKHPSIAHSAARTGGCELVHIAVEGSKRL